MSSSSRMFSSSVGASGARLGARLRVSPADPVLTVGRLRLADGEPMAIEWLSVPQALVPGLTGEELENRSFYKLLAERYGMRSPAGRRRWNRRSPTTMTRGCSMSQIHSPALSVEQITWTESRQVVDFVRSIYRGDRYRFEVELEPSAASRKRT